MGKEWTISEVKAGAKVDWFEDTVVPDAPKAVEPIEEDPWGIDKRKVATVKPENDRPWADFMLRNHQYLLVDAKGGGYVEIYGNPSDFNTELDYDKVYKDTLTDASGLFSSKAGQAATFVGLGTSGLFGLSGLLSGKSDVKDPITGHKTFRMGGPLGFIHDMVMRNKYEGLKAIQAAHLSGGKNFPAGFGGSFGQYNKSAFTDFGDILRVGRQTFVRKPGEYNFYGNVSALGIDTEGLHKLVALQKGKDPATYDWRNPDKAIKVLTYGGGGGYRLDGRHVDYKGGLAGSGTGESDEFIHMAARYFNGRHDIAQQWLTGTAGFRTFTGYQNEAAMIAHFEKYVEMAGGSVTGGGIPVRGSGHFDKSGKFVASSANTTDSATAGSSYTKDTSATLNKLKIHNPKLIAQAEALMAKNSELSLEDAVNRMLSTKSTNPNLYEHIDSTTTWEDADILFTASDSIANNNTLIGASNEIAQTIFDFEHDAGANFAELYAGASQGSKIGERNKYWGIPPSASSEMTMVQKWASTIANRPDNSLIPSTNLKSGHPIIPTIIPENQGQLQSDQIAIDNNADNKQSVSVTPWSDINKQNKGNDPRPGEDQGSNTAMGGPMDGMKRGGIVAGRYQRMQAGGTPVQPAEIPSDPSGTVSGPMGFVNAPPSQVPNQQEIADDKVASLEPESFVINAPAVSLRGEKDVKNMLMEAFMEAKSRNLPVGKVDTPLYEANIDVLLSKGEVVVPPELVQIIGKGKLEKLNNRGKRKVGEREQQAG